MPEHHRNSSRLLARRLPISPLVVLVQLLALAVLGGGVAAYASYDKTVHLSVDGRVRDVHTFARTVDAVLDRADITVGQHDLVAPQPNIDVNDGDTIVVRHGRPISLVLDNRRVVVWVTADTVEAALAQLGLTNDSAYVSASLSRAVPITGIGLTVRLPHRFTIVHDGKATKMNSNVPTVRAALREAHVRLTKGDKVSARLRSMPRNGEVITVTRIRHAKVTETTLLSYETHRVADGDMYRGTERVANSGQSGILVRHYRLKFVNGKQTQRRLVSSKVLREPQARVIKYGTKKRPIDELNWYALAGCESGHDPQAYSSRGPYYGLYQFLMESWREVGGSGDPRDASEDEQTYRAELLYQRQGTAAWPNCGHYLYE